MNLSSILNFFINNLFILLIFIFCYFFWKFLTRQTKYKYKAICKDYKVKAILSMQYSDTGIGFEGMFSDNGYMILNADTLIFISDEKPDRQVNIPLNTIKYFTYLDDNKWRFKIFYTPGGYKSTSAVFYRDESNFAFNIYATLRCKRNILKFLENNFPPPPKTITQI